MEIELIGDRVFVEMQGEIVMHSPSVIRTLFKGNIVQFSDEFVLGSKLKEGDCIMFSEYLKMPKNNSEQKKEYAIISRSDILGIVTEEKGK